MVLMAARKEPQQKRITKTSDHGPYFQRNLFHRRILEFMQTVFCDFCKATSDPSKVNLTSSAYFLIILKLSVNH